jgi:hypothetical protein
VDDEKRLENRQVEDGFYRMVPSIPNRPGANPKRTRRQPQADVAPNPIHANFFRYLSIAVLSLFKGLAVLA